MRPGPNQHRSADRFALAVVTMMVLHATIASAHGVAPQTLSVSPSPWADGGLVVPTTFGLLVTADRCTWQWVCTTHLGLAEKEIPTWFVAPTGTLFASAFSGLVLSRDHGCTFSRQPFFDSTGVSQVISSNGTIWAVSGKFGATNGLARSSDDGATFTWTPARATETFFNAVKAAPSRPERLYLSSWYFDPPSARLWVSDDGAATFTTNDLASLGALGAVFTVHAVDSQNPDVLYVSFLDTSKTPQRSVVQRSSDRGQTFSVVLEGDGAVSSIVQGNGGWFIALGDHLLSSNDGLAFTELPSPTQRACVSQVGGQTLVCGRPPLDPFSVGTLEGREVVPLLNWSSISGPVRCADGTPAAAACSTSWPVEKAELGLAADHEATCSAPEPPPKPGCCQSSVGEMSLVCLLFFRRRQRRVESVRHR